jgi:hypothetical protein
VGEIDESTGSLRLSDAERQLVLSRLAEAMSQGRITMEEFELRTGVAVHARTAAELDGVVADLPPDPFVADVVELRGTLGSVRRRGRWAVPRTLRLHRRMGSAELDFTEAEIPHPTVTIDLDVIGGSVELRLPCAASASLDRVLVTLGSAEDHRKNPPVRGIPHFEVVGTLRGGSLEVRGPRRRLFPLFRR